MTIVYRRSGTQLLARGRPPRTPGPGVAQRLRLSEVSARYVEPIENPTFVFGTTKPTAANTGPRYAALTTDNGSSGKKNITTSGTYSRINYRCQVIVAAGVDAVFEDCTFFGSPLTKYNGQSLLVASSASSCVVRFCEFTAFDGTEDRSRYWLNGITPCNNMTVERSNFHDVVDGIAGAGSNWVVRGNYGHHWSFRSDDKDHENDGRYPWWTHNDFFQPSGGDNQLYLGNSYEGTFSTNSGHYRNTAPPSIASDGTVTAGNHGTPAVGAWENAHGWLLGPRTARLTNIRIEQNWMSAGQYPVQVTAAGRGFDTGNSGSFFRNRVYVNQWPYGSQGQVQIATSYTMGTFTGIETTIYAEDDTNIPAGWRGKPVQNPTGSSSNLYRFDSSMTPPA